MTRVRRRRALAGLFLPWIIAAAHADARVVHVPAASGVAASGRPPGATQSIRQRCHGLRRRTAPAAAQPPPPCSSTPTSSSSAGVTCRFRSQASRRRVSSRPFTSQRRRQPRARSARHSRAAGNAGSRRRREPRGEAVHERARRADGLPVRPSGTYCYYYAHLDRYADDLKEGDVVPRGHIVGYVGTTGNAPPETPHLHFAVFKLGPEKRWWEGKPIDPYAIWR